MTDKANILQGARILLVDDQPANLDVLCTLLEGEGCDVALANSGERAFNIAQRMVPDLILLDVMMPPGMDGYQTCRQLKKTESTQDVPVIFITANDQAEDIVTGFQAGGVDYIPKPFQTEEALVRVGNALYTRHLFNENQAYQQEMEEELRQAHQLQMGLMPRQAPELTGYRVAGRCRPASQVGGDFFQYFERPDHDLGLALADVTGHAMAAAIPTILVMGMLQSRAEQSESLQTLFAELNRSVHRMLDKRTLVCFAMAQLDAAQRRLHLASAGCPYPLHFQAASGEVVEVPAGENYPLGVRPDTQYQTLELELKPGDRVVFCSDGIAESQNERDDLFGDDRLAELVQQAGLQGDSAQALLERIFAAVDHFGGETPQADDRTVVVLEVEK
ncbi:MAG: SpoIIE family protein phosphatase [Candidatus Latescibacteria bacterium]|nr:SpoIIE family protein phosphatase [Candidatus Latescibacterota bacterium]